MRGYYVRVVVEKIIGNCAAGYNPGDYFEVELFYIRPRQNVKVCLHALSAMLTLLMPFLKGIPADKLGIGKEADIGYIQCPDPGSPYTCGGTVIFRLERKVIRNSSS